jgi:hypothetical protein
LPLPPPSAMSSAVSVAYSWFAAHRRKHARHARPAENWKPQTTTAFEITPLARRDIC